MTNPTRIIRILPATPLPCSIYNPATGTTCGKPAEAAYAQPSSEQPPGQWLIQPVRHSGEEDV